MENDNFLSGIGTGFGEPGGTPAPRIPPPPSPRSNLLGNSWLYGDNAYIMAFRCLCPCIWSFCDIEKTKILVHPSRQAIEGQIREAARNNNNNNRRKAILTGLPMGDFFLRGGDSCTHFGYHKTLSPTIA